MSCSETRSRGVSWGFAAGSVAWLAPSRSAAVAGLPLGEVPVRLLAVLVRFDLSKDAELLVPTPAGAGQDDPPPARRSRRWSSGWRGRTRPGAQEDPGGAGAAQVRNQCPDRAQTGPWQLDQRIPQGSIAIMKRQASRYKRGFDIAHVFQAAGARVVRSAVQAPRMNAIMERWIGSCRRELHRESAIFRAGVPGRSGDPTLPSRQ